MKNTGLFTLLGLAVAFAAAPAQAAKIDVSSAQSVAYDNNASRINITDVESLEAAAELRRSSRSFRSGRGLRHRGFRSRGFKRHHFGHRRGLKRYKSFKHKSFRHSRYKHRGFGRGHFGHRGF
ncbi:MAG: hypothetical protein ABJO01_11440 [Parasphingorhabdus sp.]|uniref:hypothetical protein n=1 Tax=Parasphingorhabdus sp. TaxID=2709688 RepID=UPI003299B3F7